jgi:cardiolipin synthase A/B
MTNLLSAINLPLSGTVLLIVVNMVILVIALGVVPQNRRPSVALGWLLAILFIPIFGLLVFLLIGSPKLPKSRRDKQSKMTELIRKNTSDSYCLGDPTGTPDWALAAVKLNHQLGALPMTAGNKLELLDDYNASLETMTEAIRAARSYVHFEFYIVAVDETTEPMFQALEDAHRRGVRVRVLIDHMGSIGYPGYGDAVKRLERAGVPWRRMLPVRPWRLEYQRPDLRNHRKILVIDGNLAFTGSQNIIDRSYNKRGNKRRGLLWKDLMVRTTGPIVDELNALFITDWYAETGEILEEEADLIEDDAGGGLLCQVVPSGPGFDAENNLRLFNTLLYSAERSIVISSPYFVPDESMLYAITTAAQRGVAVRLYMGETSDQFFVYHAQRSYYQTLIEAGVDIHLYKSPYVLHSKFVIIDDAVAVIGSSNMDMRSFTLNFEVSILVCDREFVSRMLEIDREYLEASRPVQLDEWVERPLPQRFLDNVCRLTAALQ